MAAHRFQLYQHTAANVLTRLLIIAFTHVEKQTMYLSHSSKLFTINCFLLVKQ